MIKVESFEVEVQYPKRIHHLLKFLLKRMKTEKVENFFGNLHDKTEHVIHIRNLK